jgi:hypothetical protein
LYFSYKISPSNKGNNFMTISHFIKRCTLKAVVVSFASFGGLATVAFPSFAAQVNFSGWQVSGDVTTPGVGQANLSNNALLNDDSPQPDRLFNFSGNPATEATPTTPLQTFLGVAEDFLDVDSSRVAFEGSAIRNTIAAQAGDVFRFSYNFLTNETAFVNPFDDYAFFFVRNADTNQVVEFNALAFPNAASNPSSPYNTQTGFLTNSFTFSAPGNYTLALGVVDVNDYNVSSALQIRDANLEPVPEPLTIVGSLTALGFGVGLRRRFRKQA